MIDEKLTSATQKDEEAKLVEEQKPLTAEGKQDQDPVQELTSKMNNLELESGAGHSADDGKQIAEIPQNATSQGQIQEVEASSKMIDYVIPCQKKFFDDADKELTQHFDNLEFECVRSIELSGNSYGFEPCRWIAENVLRKCVNLSKVNFSDIFTTRERKDLPPALKLMIDAIIDKPIVELNLSHNAFGPDGVNAYVAFLEQCPTLEVLNLTNCGLGPIGGEMLAQAILKNDKMQLKEFYGSRGRLENVGIAALSQVFSKQKSLQKIEVYQSGIRMGLSPLFQSLLDCQATIQHVDVSDNLVKRDVGQLCTFIKTCTNVKYLNLSDSLIKKQQQTEVFTALIETVQAGSQLEHLVWNQDPKKSTVEPFVEQLKGLGQQSNLRKIELAGIFMKRDNRSQLKGKLGDTSIDLVLFKPDFTDDESEDHDDSEDESVDDDGEETPPEEEQAEKKDS